MIGAYLEQIVQIIEDDKHLSKKQRYTATRVYHRIRETGYEGKYAQVKEAVREIRRLKREVYMPLNHKPGEVQVDFRYALAKISGILRKVAFFNGAAAFGTKAWLFGLCKAVSRFEPAL